MNRRIFKSDVLEQEISEKGYVHIPFLNAVELNQCVELFNSLDPKLNVPFYSSIDSKNLSYRMKVNKELEHFLGPKINALLHNYKNIAHTFIVKHPKQTTTIPPHLDDIHVQQAQYRAINIWLPLVDVQKVNGCLRVLPYSHKLPRFHRGFGLEFIFKSFTDIIEDKLIDIPANAGDLIVYDDTLIHASWPNLSNHIRPAMVSGYVPEEADLVACFSHPDIPDDMVEYFEVDNEFWLTFDKLAKPAEKYRSLGLHHVKLPAMERAEFIAQLATLQEN